VTAPARRAWVVAAVLAVHARTDAQDVKPVPTPVPARQAASTGCAPRVWPKEAIRYEIEGDTLLTFRIAPDGAVADAAVARTSGWTLLDEASLANLRTCRFAPRQATGAGKAPVQYNWRLEGEPVVLPELAPDGCPASVRFAAFSQRDPAPTDMKGIRVRMLVTPAGQPYGVKAEAGVHPAADVDAALRYAASCRFGFPANVAGQRTDTMFGKVLFK
jgi:TonB family protein